MKHLFMNCRRVQGYLEEYSQGNLEPGTADAVAGHLNRCAQCQEDYETLFTIHCVLEAYPRIQASAEFDAQVLSQVLAQPLPAPVPSFFDRLDTIFARPTYKLLGSTALGLVLSVIVAGLVMLPYALSSPMLQTRSSLLRPFSINMPLVLAPPAATPPVANLSFSERNHRLASDEVYASSHGVAPYTYADWMHILQGTTRRAP
ncbi:MAG: hypothetical protein JO316_22480 [Abitibacteriaceae bacterium]|nr:hypothetical protein [Abditibacteriaceae bacterium]